MRLKVVLFSCIAILVFIVSACAEDSVNRANVSLANMRAEDYFANKKEIEICHAIEWGDTSKIKQLIKEGADVNSIGYKDKMNFLMWSLIKKNKVSYLFLLQNGANPNQMTSPGEKTNKRERNISVMNLVVRLDDSDWLKYALNYGGNPNLVNKKYQTIIFEAISSHCVNNIELLLSSGADINYQDKISKDTPLMEALGIQRFDIMYLLLEKGADPQLNKKDIKFYLERYVVDPAIQDYKKQLEWRKKVVSILEEKGFVFDKNSRGFTMQ